MTTRIKALILTAGALMAGTQVLVIRRALALSGGDETVFSLILAVWLWCVAGGGFLGGRLAARTESAVKWMRGGLLLLSLSAPLSLLVLQLSVIRVGWIPGTVPGGGKLFFSLFLALIPVGIFGGMLFPLTCRALKSRSSSPVCVAYLFEAAGSFLAGTITALIFAPHLGSLSMAVFFAALGVTVAVAFHRPLTVFAVLLAVVMIPLVFLQPSVQNLDRSLVAATQPGLKLLDLLETPYGQIEVSERQGQVSIHENGLLLASSDDFSTAEERAHITMAQHPRPRDVLWIGGSLGGAPGDALEHPSVERLDLVELNPVLFDLKARLNPADSGASGGDPRVTEIKADGRRYLASHPRQKYDIIALFLPGPRTARLAKFYTVEFFRIVREALKPGGVLVFPIEASESFIGDDLAALLATVNAALEAVFPTVEALPGENVYFVAGDEHSQPAADAAQIISRWEERGVEPLYWDAYRLRDRLSESHRSMLARALTRGEVVGTNRDAAPICFYLQQIVWSRQVEAGFPVLLKAARRVFVPAVLALLLTAAVIVFWAGSKPLAKRRRGSAAAAVAVVGMSGISLEILALITYQVHFSSGYREVGILMGFYMAGLALGAAAVSRARRPEALFRAVQGWWCLAPVGLIILVSPLFSSPAMLGLFGKSAVFFYMLVVGGLGGAHFPLAVAFSGRSEARRAGVFYGVDLLGASCGALIVGLLALPLIGIAWSALGMVWLNLLARWLIRR